MVIMVKRNKPKPWWKAREKRVDFDFLRRYLKINPHFLVQFFDFEIFQLNTCLETITEEEFVKSM